MSAGAREAGLRLLLRQTLARVDGGAHVARADGLREGDRVLGVLPDDGGVELLAGPVAVDSALPDAVDVGRWLITQAPAEGDLVLGCEPGDRFLVDRGGADVDRGASTGEALRDAVMAAVVAYGQAREDARFSADRLGDVQELVQRLVDDRG